MTMISETVKITKSADVRFRMDRPQPGDHVRWSDDAPLGRIWNIGEYTSDDEAMVCETQGSAFLLDSGAVSISGGPFKVVELADLTPTMETAPSWFWNWGDNLPGAGMGCEFAVRRPVFTYTPSD